APACPLCLLYLSLYPPTTHPYPLSLHDALPIFVLIATSTPLASLGRGPDGQPHQGRTHHTGPTRARTACMFCRAVSLKLSRSLRSEEHTSELQSRENLVCRLLLEKKKQYC